MKKKRIMVIGADNSGKTTLINFLNDYKGPLRKTQDIIYGKNTIDIPGSYIESPWMHKHIITVSQDASCVLFLIDQSNPKKVYPPGFAKVFKCPVIGVISKVDLMKKNWSKSNKYLEEAGVVKPYYAISFENEIGIEDLKEYLISYKG